jgi:hypothetical protein
MTDAKESHIRTALRHVHEGRARIKKQYEIIENLHLAGRDSEGAEKVLDWFKKVQLEFESEFNKLLGDGQEKLRQWGYKDPTDDWSSR